MEITPPSSSDTDPFLAELESLLPPPTEAEQGLPIEQRANIADRLIPRGPYLIHPDLFLRALALCPNLTKLQLPFAPNEAKVKAALDHCPHLHELDLGMTGNRHQVQLLEPAAQPWKDLLQSCPRLRVLRLHHAIVHIRYLKALGTLTQLHGLCLEDVTPTTATTPSDVGDDRWVKHLRSKNLRYLKPLKQLKRLSLRNNRYVSDKACQHLKSLKSLELLDLTGTSVSLAKLMEEFSQTPWYSRRRMLPELKELRVSSKLYLRPKEDPDIFARSVRKALQWQKLNRLKIDDTPLATQKNVDQCLDFFNRLCSEAFVGKPARLDTEKLRDIVLEEKESSNASAHPQLHLMYQNLLEVAHACDRLTANDSKAVIDRFDAKWGTDGFLETRAGGFPKTNGPIAARWEYLTYDLYLHYPEHRVVSGGIIQYRRWWNPGTNNSPHSSQMGRVRLDLDVLNYLLVRGQISPFFGPLTVEHLRMQENHEIIGKLLVELDLHIERRLTEPIKDFAVWLAPPISDVLLELDHDLKTITVHATVPYEKPRVGFLFN